jgi:hypothetical protein
MEEDRALPPSEDRAAGLRPQPPAASSRSSIPSAERRIPDSWFSAQSMSTTMCFVANMDRREPRRLQEGERYLGWFVLPPFQRPPVWTLAQKARFIESAWMGLPLGVFVWNEAGYGSRFGDWLLDGQQRITAVLEYMADEFPVYGYRFSELTGVDHRRWEMSTSFPCLRTRLEDEAALRDVYERLAYGGTPHAQGTSAREG